MVTIVGDAGNPVNKAVAEATWTFADPPEVYQQATTSRTGLATFRGTKDGPTLVQFCVTNVTKSGFAWAPGSIDCYPLP